MAPRACSPASQRPSTSNQLLEAKRFESKTDPRTFRGADLLAATRYEDAPAFFDLALSDEMLQIAAEYMGEIPVLAKPRLWWTKPEAYGPGGPQLFHIGARARPVVVRQAKFLFAMSDVDQNSGPFTFLPLNISQEIVRAIDYEMGEEIPDEVIFSYAKPTDVRRFTGKAGTGIFVDTSRCFHFGRRQQSKERLILMIQYKWKKRRSADRPRRAQPRLRREICRRPAQVADRAGLVGRRSPTRRWRHTSRGRRRSAPG